MLDITKEFSVQKCTVIEISDKSNISNDASIKFRFTEDYIISGLK